VLLALGAITAAYVLTTEVAKSRFDAREDPRAAATTGAGA
jgi:hypothetical protein